MVEIAISISLNQIIAIGVLIFMLGIMFWIFTEPNRDKKINTPCPHGHEDWDDCPDCCH